MGTTLALFGDLYHHVGPGLFLAFALPIFAGVLGVVLLQAYKRIRDRGDEVTDTV